MNNIKQIQDLAKKLLSEKKVDVVIGYEQGSLPLRSTPCFITKPEDASRLIWDATCSNNLSVYLPALFRAVRRSRNQEEKLRVGVVAKGCDSRSLVGHIKEKQVQREELYIIGVPCSGTVDLKKVNEAVGGKEVREAEIQGDSVKVKGNGFTKDLKLTEVLRECCLACQGNNPVISDVLVGSTAGEVKQKDPNAQVNAIEAMDLEEKWQDFQEEIKKCIRCYACRNACPLCYCTECFVDQSLPQWIGISDDLSDTAFFQLIRIFHTAGRCVDCGACAAACPMGVDLRKYTQKLNKDVEALFKYKIGQNVEEAPALQAFKTDDPQEFILEPE
jgi:coenzyme F420-reducing hydrogenase beta subunit